MRLPLTPSQTAGPFLHLGRVWPGGADVVSPGTEGAVEIGGQVLDGAGDPVTDALVETWQVRPDGTPAGPGFRGLGRCPTGPDGHWAVRTLKPGAVVEADGVAQAPHLDVAVFARGLLDRVVTRVYFDDEPAANAADPVLGGLPAVRRGTLLARRDAAGYRFDIRLQGEAETVFFDV
jgi:protocatechuate 3,4-dioxygenase alpha subunit